MLGFFAFFLKHAFFGAGLGKRDQVGELGFLGEAVDPLEVVEGGALGKGGFVGGF